MWNGSGYLSEKNVWYGNVYETRCELDMAIDVECDVKLDLAM